MFLTSALLVSFAVISNGMPCQNKTLSGVGTPTCVGSFCCDDVSCATNCSNQGCSYGGCEVSLCKCHSCGASKPKATCESNHCGQRCMFMGCWSGACSPNGDCQCNHCLLPHRPGSKEVCQSETCLNKCKESQCEYGRCNDRDCECHFCTAM